VHTNDIIAEFKFLSPPNDPAAQFASELLASRIDTTPSLARYLRRGAAAALVRAGIWLDRRAGERVLRPTTN
jgi:hypothetical protein